MFRLRKTTPGEPLIVSMTGLRLGERVLIAGAGDPKGAALLAMKPGLTGRVCIVDEDAGRTARAADVAQREGVLVEPQTVPLEGLPFEAGAFDVVVVSHALRSMMPDRRIAMMHEAARVLRSGGRCVVIERAPRGGLIALFRGGSEMSRTDVETLMSAAPFRGVRTLAERQGLIFVEGARQNV